MSMRLPSMRRRAFALIALVCFVFVTILSAGVVADRKSDDGFDVIHDDDLREPELESEPAPEFFFIYLMRDPERTDATAKEISSAWTTMMRSAGQGAELFAIDATMFACRAAKKYVNEYVEFFLDQPETHYVDINGQKIYRKGTEDAPQAATSAKKDAELKNKRIDAKLKQRKAKKAAKLKKKRAKMGEL